MLHTNCYLTSDADIPAEINTISRCFIIREHEFLNYLGLVLSILDICSYVQMIRNVTRNFAEFNEVNNNFTHSGRQMELPIVSTDLLQYDGHIAHCVAEDLVLGAGIAKPIKHLMGGVSQLEAQSHTVGSCPFVKQNNRYIFNLVTKTDSRRARPTLVSLKAALDALHSQCVRLNVHEVHIPRIGCGLDRLSWNEVSVVIKATLVDTEPPIAVVVHSPPSAVFRH